MWVKKRGQNTETCYAFTLFLLIFFTFISSTHLVLKMRPLCRDPFQTILHNVVTNNYKM